MTPRYQCVIFDWDGTLHNSSKAVVANIQAVAQHFNHLPPRAEQIIALMGLNLAKIFPLLFPEENQALYPKMVDLYLEISHQNRDKEAFFTGAYETLQALKDTGLTLAIATGKTRRGLDDVLALHPEVAAFFSLTRTGDETASKPSPKMLESILASLKLAPQQAIMVGDTTYDLEMARVIGMDRVGITHGSHNEAALIKEDPLEIIHHLPELLPLVIH